MISQWWSWALSAIGAMGLLLQGRSLPAGPAIGIGVQGLWVIYTVYTRQWGFLFGVALFTPVNAINLRRLLKARQQAKTSIPDTG